MSTQCIVTQLVPVLTIILNYLQRNKYTVSSLNLEKVFVVFAMTKWGNVKLGFQLSTEKHDEEKMVNLHARMT